jgi:thiosulfate reductase cytochrome b subunit
MRATMQRQNVTFGSRAPVAAHARWVRILHWTGATSIIALVFSGFVILMAHPRLYWGNVGNDLTPALLELPISRNYTHGGWETPQPFVNAVGPAKAVSAGRTYEIFNQNGWARSLHFLAGWGLVVFGLCYLTLGIGRGHFRRHIFPGSREWTVDAVAGDLRDHLRFRVRAATGGPDYGVLQKFAYSKVIFIVAPLMALTGLAMSPAITASVPSLVAAFGGFQSARTIHFFVFVALALFVMGHVGMVIATGFTRQMRGMLLGQVTPDDGDV